MKFAALPNIEIYTFCEFKMRDPCELLYQMLPWCYHKRAWSCIFSKLLRIMREWELITLTWTPHMAYRPIPQASRGPSQLGPTDSFTGQCHSLILYYYGTRIFTQVKRLLPPACQEAGPVISSLQNLLLGPVPQLIETSFLQTSWTIGVLDG